MEKRDTKKKLAFKIINAKLLRTLNHIFQFMHICWTTNISKTSIDNFSLYRE